MANGILLAATGGTGASGRAVGPDNPVPFYTPAGYGAQFTDGTRFVDVVSFGTANAAWNEGITSGGKDTLGTFYPLPLTAGGGAVPVVPSFPGTITEASATITTVTVATVVPAAASGSHNYILGIQTGNSSGTLVTVAYRDGAGTIKVMPLAASGGGHVMKFAWPGLQLTGTNALTANISQGTTSSVFVNVDYRVAP